LQLRTRVGYVLVILPFLSEIQNRVGLIMALLMTSSRLKIKLKNGTILNLDKRKNNVFFQRFQPRFIILRNILGILTFSTSFTIKGKNTIEFSLDMKNFFVINLDELNYEDYNLLELLYSGTRFGADFITEKKGKFNDYRKKTILILQMGKRKVIETYDGIKFYLDSINPGTFTETFVRDIHMINPDVDWNGKMVLDVGAECGDTALYFAKMGATVLAFEPSSSNYQAMLTNLELNPDISKDVFVNYLW